MVDQKQRRSGKLAAKREGYRPMQAAGMSRGVRAARREGRGRGRRQKRASRWQCSRGARPGRPKNRYDADCAKVFVDFEKRAKSSFNLRRELREAPMRFDTELSCAAKAEQASNQDS